MTEDKSIVSKRRVTDYGEVLTGKREVNAMLDLVKQETERIESRFLEPACGNGNYLTAILERKLTVVEKRYGKSLLDFERYGVLAVSSLYGIDILEDNVRQCRHRLYSIFDSDFYSRLFTTSAKERCREVVRFILERNIVWGDALDLKTKNEPRRPIVFSEWSPLSDGMVKRRDFFLSYLLEKRHQLSLFNDESQEANLNRPVKEYPPIHFLEIPHAQP